MEAIVQSHNTWPTTCVSGREGGEVTPFSKMPLKAACNGLVTDVAMMHGAWFVVRLEADGSWSTSIPPHSGYAVGSIDWGPDLCVEIGQG